jgi:hypothetical protein
MLIGKGSAVSTWEAIKMHQQGNDRVRDTRVHRLRTEFESISFKPGERIDEFGTRITNLASTLRSLGDVCNDEKVVRKFLSVVPSCFVQIAFSMETMVNPAELTVKEVVGHLRAIEERLDDEQESAGGQGSSGGQLLLTEDQWQALKNGVNDKLLLTEREWEARKGQSRGGSSDHGKAVSNDDGDHEKYRYCSKKGPLGL